MCCTKLVTAFIDNMSPTTRALSRPLVQYPFPAPRSFSASHRPLYRRQPGDPTGPNEPPSHLSTPAPRSKSPLKVWPILGIFALGSFLFKQIVDQRKEQAAYQPKGPVVGYSSTNTAPSGRSIKPSHPH
jgi:UMP-CMP kinase